MPSLDTKSEAARKLAEGVFSIVSREQFRQLSELTCGDDLEGRVEELAKKANEGTLTNEERHEYEGYVQANYVVGMLTEDSRKILAL